MWWWDRKMMRYVGLVVGLGDDEVRRCGGGTGR